MTGTKHERPGATDLLLEQLDQLVARHGECDGARIFAARLSPAEARTFAAPFCLALARRTTINGPEDSTDA